MEVQPVSLLPRISSCGQENTETHQGVHLYASGMFRFSKRLETSRKRFGHVLKIIKKLEMRFMF